MVHLVVVDALLSHSPAGHTVSQVSSCASTLPVAHVVHTVPDVQMSHLAPQELHPPIENVPPFEGQVTVGVPKYVVAQVRVPRHVSAVLLVVHEVEEDEVNPAGIDEIVHWLVFPAQLPAVSQTSPEVPGELSSQDTPSHAPTAAHDDVPGVPV